MPWTSTCSSDGTSWPIIQRATGVDKHPQVQVGNFSQHELDGFTGITQRTVPLTWCIPGQTYASSPLWLRANTH
ncbi:hypothetical protein AcW1_000382 [Taiwanofungus camphoratus]|nr:hypothetical protein AcW1_000382 [Antrodia cinnamomea]